MKKVGGTKRCFPTLIELAIGVRREEMVKKEIAAKRAGVVRLHNIRAGFEVLVYACAFVGLYVLTSIHVSTCTCVFLEKSIGFQVGIAGRCSKSAVCSSACADTLTWSTRTNRGTDFHGLVGLRPVHACHQIQWCHGRGCSASKSNLFCIFQSLPWFLPTNCRFRLYGTPGEIIKYRLVRQG